MGQQDAHENQEREGDGENQQHGEGSAKEGPDQQDQDTSSVSYLQFHGCDACILFLYLRTLCLNIHDVQAPEGLSRLLRHTKNCQQGKMGKTHFLPPPTPLPPTLPLVPAL
jgi:hypothetical protein